MYESTFESNLHVHIYSGFIYSTRTVQLRVRVQELAVETSSRYVSI